MYDSRIIKSLVYLLRFLGVDPYGKRNAFKICAILIPIFTTLYLAIYLLHHDDVSFDEFTNCVETIMTTVHSLVKYLIFIISHRQLQLIIQQLKDLVQMDDLNTTLVAIYTRDINQIKLFVKRYLSMIVFLMTLNIMKPIIFNEPIFLLYVPQFVPKPVFLICNTAAVFLIVILVTSMDIFAYVFISLVTVKIRILNQKISGIGDGSRGLDSDRLVAIRIEKWVEEHAFFYSYFGTLNAIIKWTVLSESCITIVATAFELHLIVNRMSSFIDLGKSLLYILSTVVQMSLLYCCPGAKLTIEASETSTLFYDLPWYNFSASIKTTLLIIMTRLQKDTIICIGNILVVNYETIVIVFKAAFSYFTTLQAMQQMYGEK